MGGSLLQINEFREWSGSQRAYWHGVLYSNLNIGHFGTLLNERRFSTLNYETRSYESQKNYNFRSC